MRTILLALLLAGAASPALSAEPNRWGPRERGGDRSEARSERSEPRAERTQRSSEARKADTAAGAERRAPATIASPRSIETPKSEPVVHRRSFEVRSVDDGLDRRKDAVRRMRSGQSESGVVSRGAREVRPPAAPAMRRAGDTVRELRMRDRKPDDSSASIEKHNVRLAPGVRESRGLVEQKRPIPAVFDQKERRVSRVPRFGAEPPAPRTATAKAARAERRWSSDWRHDRRYDWKHWRRSNRLRFHYSYYDPFGWDYFRYGLGWRLWPSYYRSSFWLNDPWHYRLPPAYGPYRWVRYHRDALLVNIYTGQVVDVVYDFFW